MSIWRVLSLALSLCMVLGCSSPKGQSGTERPAPGQAQVKGRVFLITRGGDLKPARLADVYLISADAMPDEGAVKSKTRLIESECRFVDEQREIIGRHPDIAGTISAYIEGHLSTYKRVLSELQNLFAAGVGQKKSFAVQADEEGNFMFARVATGSYTLVAFGQAGVNLGYWEQSVQVTATEQPEVKLSVPVTACSML